MVRALKPMEVETVKTKYGIDAVIYFDRNRKDFFAEVCNTQLRAGNVGAVRDDIHKTVAENNQVEWFPVIEVTKTDGNSLYGKVGLSVDRNQYGYTPDGKLKVVQWGAEGDNRIAFSRAAHWRQEWGIFSPPVRPGKYNVGSHASESTYGERSYKGQTYYFPYTVELWNGLQQIVEMINMLREKLDSLIDEDEGTELIALAGMKAVLALTESTQQPVSA